MLKFDFGIKEAIEKEKAVVGSEATPKIISFARIQTASGLHCDTWTHIAQQFALSAAVTRNRLNVCSLLFWVLYFNFMRTFNLTVWVLIWGLKKNTSTHTQKMTEEDEKTDWSFRFLYKALSDPVSMHKKFYEILLLHRWQNVFSPKEVLAELATRYLAKTGESARVLCTKWESSLVWSFSLNRFDKMPHGEVLFSSAHQATGTREVHAYKGKTVDAYPCREKPECPFCLSFLRPSSVFWSLFFSWLYRSSGNVH